jgi:hypothetical protein
MEFIFFSGVDKASVDPTASGTPWVVGGVCKRHRIVKFVVSCFRLDSIFLTERGNILDPHFEIGEYLC